jgi:hypothetical protein
MKNVNNKERLSQLSRTATLVHKNGTIESRQVLKATDVNPSIVNIKKYETSSPDKSLLYQSYGL